MTLQKILFLKSTEMFLVIEEKSYIESLRKFLRRKNINIEYPYGQIRKWRKSGLIEVKTNIHGSQRNKIMRYTETGRELANVLRKAFNRCKYVDDRIRESN